MSLIEEIKEHYSKSDRPVFWDYLDDAELVAEEPINKVRWGTLTKYVMQRGDEYVAIETVVPATESQDWGDYGVPTIYTVKPVPVTVTSYKRI